MFVELPPELWEKVRGWGALASEKYRSREDLWGKGLLSEGFVEPMCVGKMGELGLWTALSEVNPDFPMPDMSIHNKGGAPFDFVYDDCRIEVKTSTRDYGSLLVRVTPFDFNVVVSATQKYPGVVLNGWCFVEDLLARPSVPARRGDHLNKEVRYKDLYSMSKLVNVFRQVKG